MTIRLLCEKSDGLKIAFGVRAIAATVLLMLYVICNTKHARQLPIIFLVVLGIIVVFAVSSLKGSTFKVELLTISSLLSIVVIGKIVDMGSAV